jgi:hypothetical protein
MFKLYYELDTRIEELWATYQDPNTTEQQRWSLAMLFEELSEQQEQILTTILEDEAKQSRGEK